MSRERERDRERRGFNVGRIVIIVVIVAVAVWLIQAVVTGFILVQEPDAVPDPTATIDGNTAEEAGGVTDGGPLTNQPNQAMPEEDRIVEEPADAPGNQPQPPAGG